MSLSNTIVAANDRKAFSQPQATSDLVLALGISPVPAFVPKTAAGKWSATDRARMRSLMLRIEQIKRDKRTLTTYQAAMQLATANMLPYDEARAFATVLEVLVDSGMAD